MSRTTRLMQYIVSQWVYCYVNKLKILDVGCTLESDWRISIQFMNLINKSVDNLIENRFELLLLIAIPYQLHNYLGA